MMKKLFLIMMVLVMTVCCQAALAAGEIPQEIADLFDGPAWEGYSIPRCTSQPEEYACFLCDESLDGSDYGFGLAVLQKGERNVLCLIEKIRGTWRVTGRNHEALPRGDRVPYLLCDLSDDITIWGDRDTVGEETYKLNLHLDSDGYWRFSSIEDKARSLDAAIAQDRLTYYLYASGGFLKQTKTVRGVYDNTFEAFNFHYFPATFREAEERLSFAPDIPLNAGDPWAFCSPVLLDLRTGEKYDVFTAPSRASLRAANGRAVMSTNDWVQIFGEENGFLLVQYDVSGDQMRFGYIDASALPRSAYVRSLAWARLPCTVLRTTWLTDDPLGACGTLLRISEGDELTLLAVMDTWVYVETTSGTTAVRGFIPAEDVQLPQAENAWDALDPNG